MSVEHNGWRSESNTLSAEQLRKAVDAPSEDDETSEAAAKLGKKGGAAAAEARKAKPKEEPKEEPEVAEKAEEPVKEAKPDEKDEADKRRRGAKERVEQATQETAELRRQLRARDQELAKLRAPKPAERVEARAEDSDDPEPQMADGDDEVAFLEAKARWWARQEFQTLSQKKEAERREVEFTEHVEKMSKTVETAITAEGGQTFLDEMTEDVLLLEPSVYVMARGEKPDALNALADEVLRAGEKAPRLMRYLSEHPDVFQRVSSPTLRPSDFTREMGRIEARLEAATSGPTAPVKLSSQAPKPARPVAGSPAIADSAPGREAPYEEHAAYYNAQERRKRTA